MEPPAVLKSPPRCNMACLPKRFIRIALLGLIATVPLVATLAAPRSDPCNKIAGQEFVPPSDALACLKSFSFNRTLQNNVMDVVSGVLDFFTFEDWYFDSPPPFQESTLNIPKELARIRNTRYPVRVWSLQSSKANLMTGHHLDGLRFQ